MNKISFKTKIETIIAIVIIIILAGVSVSSLTRTITDSSDNIITFVSNSNGKIWGANGSNIQLAINDLGSNGGAVYIPSGIYYFSSPLNLANRTSIFGGGMGNTVIKANGDFYDPNGYGLVKGYEPYKLHNVTISDLTIDGNNITNCINVHSAKDFILTNILTENALGTAINLRDTCERFSLSNIYIHNVTVYQGLSYNGTHGVFENIHIWDVKDSWGIDVYPKYCTFNNIIITDCAMGIKIPGTRNCTFSNFIISNTTDSDGFKVQDCYDSSFSNIIVENSAWNGLVIMGTTYNCNFNNCFINDSVNIGVSVDGVKINLNNIQCYNANAYAFNIGGNNITISNSIFKDNGVYNLINGADDIKIIGCDISYGDDPGIYINNSNRLIISDSTISNHGGSGITFYNSTCKNITINNCFIQNNNGYGIYFMDVPHYDFKITDCSIISNNNYGIYLANKGNSRFLITNNIILDNTNGAIHNDSSASQYIISNNLT